MTAASADKCNNHLFNVNVSKGYCPEVWDGFLCWPRTAPNTVASLPCPVEKGLDISKLASRECGPDGEWIGKPSSLANGLGWTNYTSCFTDEVRFIMNRLYHGSPDDIQKKLNTAKYTRTVEVIGLGFSLVSLIASLLIFYGYSSLKNKRTKLHRNLFLAMFIQVTVRLVLYTDQWITRDKLDSYITGGSQIVGIENTVVLCEFFYSVMEYAQTAVFTWMFLEGVQLHTSIIVVFPRKIKFFMFHVIGWGFPLLLVLIWAATMVINYQHTLCWWGYHFSSYFWILEGPRMLIILVNLVILLNIVCVVIVKVQQSTSNEFLQIRKAIRAALLLLPLLGITNLLDVIPGPLEGTPLEFAVWSYTTHLLSSCQGLFISSMYCFLNKEVREAIKKHWKYRKICFLPSLRCKWEKEGANNGERTPAFNTGEIFHDTLSIGKNAEPRKV